ncbi:hypothetical protein HBZS_117950 [Helicobacter bizzozeronii CCUG 35545]|nr:hypothetical protein HBZS_117950 [Helicobacter bizzozeronii CCUG 35545]
MKISLLAPIEVNQEVYFNATTTHASTKKIISQGGGGIYGD